MELSEHLAAIRKTMGADRDNFYSQSCSGGFLNKTSRPQPLGQGYQLDIVIYKYIYFPDKLLS